MYELKNCGIIVLNPASPPEYRNYFLVGEVYGNSKFKDGSRIRTSRIVNVKEFDGYKVITTSNSEYKIDINSVTPKCIEEFNTACKTFSNKITYNSNSCVCCGKDIPEGKQVCYTCEKG